MFPIEPGGKRPLHRGWQQEATRDIDVIRRWGIDHPDANFGLTNVVGIDLDRKNGADGVELFGRWAKALALTRDELFTALTVTTATGSAHAIFALPGGFDALALTNIRPAAIGDRPDGPDGRPLGSGIDLRIGMKGYLVAAGSIRELPVIGDDGEPSIHPVTEEPLTEPRRYRVHNVPPGIIGTPPPALLADIKASVARKKTEREAPLALAKVAEFDSAYGLAALTAECKTVRETSSGGQNSTLNASTFTIGRLVGGGELTLETAREALIEAGLAMLGDPHRGDWSLDEIAALVDRALADGIAKPRNTPGMDIAATFGGVDVPESPAPHLPAGGASRFCLRSLDDLEHEAPRKQVIKGLIALGDLVCIFGLPSTGKSVVAPYLAWRVAQGVPVFGMKTVAGPVIYASAEDPHGMCQRLRALRKVYGDVVSFHLATGLAGMMANLNSAEMQDLLACIARLNPVLVVIDTLAVAFPIDENAPQGMGAVVQICRLIADQGPTVALVHHCPKGDTSTPRGHSSLNGALDTSVRVDPADTAGVIRCASMKNRNGFPRRFGFKIRSELLGHDEDGDPITAPVCEEFDLRNLPKDAKLSGAKLDALAVLDDLAGGGGRVAMADWRARCIMPGVLSESADAKARADTFGRAKRELLRAGLITILVDGASEWVARKSDLENFGPVEIPDF
ncbi:hypothetical protein AQZ50_04560 [Novosphingobium sp. Fuku2-ISO-50]|nr:hypothetical protein AQZ50_04560 [Novosphingobium sp. Fuku2-ISO-50]